MNLITREVIGVEALVRWEHRDFGVLAPEKFIDLAEDTGLIADIGDAVMSTACTQIRLWHESGFGPLRVSINVSARHLQQPDFLDRLVAMVSENKLDPSSVQIEITETSIIENADSAARVLSSARELGMTVAIDDFGTGYSSLSRLAITQPAVPAPTTM